MGLNFRKAGPGGVIAFCRGNDRKEPPGDYYLEIGGQSLHSILMCRCYVTLWQNGPYSL